MLVREMSKFDQSPIEPDGVEAFVDAETIAQSPTLSWLRCI